MRIAVIGFRSYLEFIDWCKRYDLKRCTNKVYCDGDNVYYAIFTQTDLTGREFDDYLEVDYLKEDLMRRIRRK